MRCNCVEELKKRGYNIKDEQRRWDIYKDTYLEAFFSTGKEEGYRPLGYSQYGPVWR